MNLCRIEFISDTECIVTERITYLFKRKHRLFLSKEEVTESVFATYRDVALWAFCPSGKIAPSELRRTLNYYKNKGDKHVTI
jgi:hypothetical protein